MLFALKEIAQDNKVNTSALKVEVSTDFVIDTTSNLNRQASATSNLKQAEKLRVISDEMFISMKTLDQKDLERARKNYVNNVIMPYRQKDYNPLGFNIGDKLPNGDYATPASRWIDFNANLNGTVGDATDLIKHLKVTFGTYRNGNYVLEGSDKETIRNLLNNVLSKAISETGDVQSIKKSLKIPTKELGAQERRKVISGIDYIRSDFLDTLRKEGLLDLDQVVLYNRKISEVKGKSIKYKNAEKQLNQYKTAALRNASSQVRIREKALRDIAKALPEKQIIAGAELDQNIFNTFVSNAGALENSDEMIKRIAQGSDLSEGEVRDQVSRSIISHIEKQTMGRQIEIANSANEFTYDFDHRAFSSIIDQNRDALEKVMGDKFYSLEAISTLLRIQNRRVSDYLMEGGVSLSTAGGLSLESMVSRVYSISRGVVSPRYVATEIALLKLRQANLSIIKEILDDPKLTDDLIELVETEKFEIIERITPKLLPILVSTLAKYETVSKQERVKKQITEMEAKREKR